MDTSVLLEILRDQREEIDSLRSQCFCKRKEEDLVKLDSKKAQVVIGVRRSGKSTLCFNALNKARVKFAYVNFDDERLVRLSAEDLNEVLKSLYQIYGDFTHLFLDEAQNVEGWHLFVNRLLRQGMLYVKPLIYVDNPRRDKSKAKDLAHLTVDGYVKAYSYHADGSIHPFKVSYDASGSPIPSISFEHTPAISLIISKGNYPEISNLIANKKPDANKLQKEMGDVLKRMTCVLMQKDQNVRKKDAW